MARDIHIKDFPILLALIKKPMGTAEDITKEANKVIQKQNGEAIKLNENTVARRLKKLNETGAIYGARVYLNVERLGLQQYFFLIQIHEDNWERNSMILSQFCDSHPYTSYRDMVFGGSLNGIMAYFLLPSDSEALGLLLQCFEILKERKIISDYTRYQVKNRYINEANLEKFDIRTNQWDIDYNKIDEKLKTRVESESSNPQESILSKLDGFDMALIREMTRDCRRPQKQILEEMMDPNHPNGMDYTREFRDQFRDTPQTISRRLKELDNLQVFDGYQLHYHAEDFGMFNTVLFIADHIEGSETSLVKAMQDGDIPFPSRVGLSMDKIIFWMSLPPNAMPKLVTIFMSYFKNLQVFLFGDDLFGYYFWHENYDLETKEWKVSKEWIIDTPMRELDLRIKDIENATSDEEKHS